MDIVAYITGIIVIERRIYLAIIVGMGWVLYVARIIVMQRRVKKTVLRNWETHEKASIIFMDRGV
jgi:hypothetical protein